MSGPIDVLSTLTYDWNKNPFLIRRCIALTLDSLNLCERAATSSYSHVYPRRAASAHPAESRRRRVSGSTDHTRLGSSVCARRANWQLHVASRNNLDIHHHHCFRVYEYGFRSLNSDANCGQAEWPSEWHIFLESESDAAWSERRSRFSMVNGAILCYHRSRPGAGHAHVRHAGKQCAVSRK